MKAEDYLLTEWKGKWYHWVPEVEERSCDMCAFKSRLCHEVIRHVEADLKADGGCSQNKMILVEKEKFTEYVVEVVSRRIS